MKGRTFWMIVRHIAGRNVTEQRYGPYSLRELDEQRKGHTNECRRAGHPHRCRIGVARG